MDLSTVIQVGAAIAAVGIVLFIPLYLGRRFVLWYFRIPELIDHLASIDESLRQLPAAQAYRARKLAQRSRAA